MEDYDSLPFRKFTFRSEMDKAIHTLEGILKGIAIDKIINEKELMELEAWHNSYQRYLSRHPFNELIPLITESISDGYLDDDELKGILWVCNNFKTKNIYFNVVTSSIQRLHGIIHGILSDNRITEEEIIGLRNWLDDHEFLTKTYPYDEINSLIVSVMSDGIISSDEQKLLKLFFSEFVELDVSQTIDIDELNQIKNEITINGICSICPEIFIHDSLFCFTGASSRTTRQGLKNIIEALGGKFTNNVTQKTNYLVIGNEGNPCWAFSCYGRKVEAAVNLRKCGHKILIVHENDFWDSLEDLVDQSTS